MKGDRVTSCVKCALCGFFKGDMFVVPTGTNLYCNGSFFSGGILYGFDNFVKSLRIPGEGRTGFGFDDFGNRASAVDVDAFGVSFFYYNACGAGHGFRISAKNLHGICLFVVGAAHESFCFFVVAGKGFGADHFGVGKACSVVYADGTKRTVAVTRYRSKKQVSVQFD